MATPSAFDVVVIGAGPAGSATARWLALAGCRVLLVERSHFESLRVGESLAPDVQPLLMSLGVWNRFGELAAVPSWGTRSVWGDDEPQEHSHLMSPFGCGWHVERAGFDRMLAEAAADAGATLRLGSTLASCVDEGVAWRLTLTSVAGSTIEAARILVDATGRAARVSKRLGAHRVAADTLVGITAWFDGVDTSHQGFTLVEAEADGWWYSAPAGTGQMAAMLMTDGDLAGRADILTQSAWRTRLGKVPVTASRLASASNVRGPQAFSATSHRLRRPNGAGRWLAVGDAAMAVDPISGSGVVRALRTAQHGAKAALAMLERPGSEALQEYESARDGDWHEYLDERAMYYGVEDRWPASPFWRRRHVARQLQEA